MGNPFSATSVNSYNANPPADDGSQVASNLVAWNTIKTKLPDPIKTAFDTSETATNNAFAKIIGGGGFTTTAVDYTVLAADQGKFVKCTASGKIITTPDATVVGSPFVFIVVNESTGDITLSGNNPGVQQNVDGAATLTIPAGAGCMVNTDGTNWFTGGQNFTKTNIAPQGRLTLVSGTPIISSDQTAKTAVFYTPYNGDLIPIPNGTTFSLKEFSELTLTLNGTNYTAGNIFDVFVALNPADNATIIIGSGPAWSTATPGSCARGSGAGTTEIAILKGFNVNNNAITLRNNTTTYSVAAKSAIYVGTIFVDTTNGQLNCHTSFGQSRVWGVWNAFNQMPITLKQGDSTASWNYSTATIRPSNNSTANSLTVLCGLAKNAIDLQFVQKMHIIGSATSFAFANTYIGWNSTTAGSGKAGTYGTYTGGNLGGFGDAVAKFLQVPSLGINVVTALEGGGGSGGEVDTFYGTEANMLLSAKWDG